MRIEVTGIHVDDQDKALAFYTEVLGFVKKDDFPLGPFKWLTVVSPESPTVELLLEPNENPAAKAYQQALYEQGLPHMIFAVDDIHAEYDRLEGLGVALVSKPVEAMGVAQFMLDDTCGNRILLYQKLG